MFAQLCEEMDTEHTHLLLNAEVDGFLKTFLLEKQSPLAVYFSDTEWVAKLACLCDIVNLLNELNLLPQERMTNLSKDFEHYFLTTRDSRNEKEWICDLFLNKPDVLTLSVLEEDQLLEIANDGGLKSVFETTVNIHILWINIKEEYPEIATEVLKSLLPISTFYLCE
ncbi:Zinc finger MYM-type protein 6 [Plecturocebus cupreus]